MLALQVLTGAALVLAVRPLLIACGDGSACRPQTALWAAAIVTALCFLGASIATVASRRDASRYELRGVVVICAGLAWIAALAV